MNESAKREISQLLAHSPIDAETVPEWFHKGQREAWETDKRFVLLLAGTQSGKTVAGAYLLLREIQRTASEGVDNDYLIVGPDTELLKKKAIPAFQKAAQGMAEYRSSDKCFVFSKAGAKRLTGVPCRVRVFVGYATKPDSLEAATYKAIWADECGQADFLRGSWEALQRRAAIFRARFFLTTTPYEAVGWLKDLYDDATTGRNKEVAVVRFRSIDNPAFKDEEWQRMKREMPEWRFRTYYEGEFTRPPGAVFDCFERTKNVVAPFAIPAHWPRSVGIDFGDSNTAAVFLAEDPATLDLYVYDDYRPSRRTVEEHVREITRRAAGEPAFCVGGAWGEDEWRMDYIAAGLMVARAPIKELEVGVQRVYRQIKFGKLKLLADREELIAEVESYARELDDRGEPLSEIRDRARFHRLDALRYIVSAMRASAEPEVTRHSRLDRPGHRALRRIV